MGYRWEEHRETCYRLYIEQGWPLERIMAYLQSSAGFTPSRRAFQDQFRRWDFPPKVKSHDQDGSLVARVRELWEMNLTQRGMTQMLRQEGFLVTSADVAKLRGRIGLQMRGPNVEKPKFEFQGESQQLETEDSGGSIDVPFPLRPEGGVPMSRTISTQSSSSSSLFHRDPEPLEHRDAKKRRTGRKDTPGTTARYPSEMTLDDARRKLGLDKAAYRSLRDVFTRVCATLNISRKMDEPEKWESAKTRLMHDLPMLYEKLCTPRDELEMKQVALDAICKDVAKSKRYTESKMTQMEAKMALRINPQEAREMRLVLTELLEAFGFANKPDGTLAPTPTPQQWDELKGLWGQRSGPVRRILSEIRSGQGEGSKKAKALDSLARDILKRLRDNRPDRHSRKQQQTDRASTEARQSHASPLQGIDSHPDPHSSAGPTDLGHGLSTATSQPYTDGLPARDDDVNPLQPLLFPADVHAGLLTEPYATQPPSAPMLPHGASTPAPGEVTVYFASHPSSIYGVETPFWVDMIGSQTMEGVQQAVANRFPGAACLNVYGVFTHNGGESIPLNDDYDLTGYLSSVKPPMLSVQLVHELP
ncbi:uncharacterized protein TRIREDRAFT_63955 [Trichoderma reesei QM6a]|uniref:Predicted protein n=2 Tax=Hypocrea jecorina TaxID=51453 RepID=G0RN08_HYPJQ|nr:uncharacterized protein TRIREDRAFT_63955 [Trichoderma reesei QM6a]EGR47580.1 predicted protein [Trichoderma reesei QM6a]ETS00821.1 hypothetical protein M419DRAFT_82371 [Trichoderma reesei RUT C-30]